MLKSTPRGPSAPATAFLDEGAHRQRSQCRALEALMAYSRFASGIRTAARVRRYSRMPPVQA